MSIPSLEALTQTPEQVALIALCERTAAILQDLRHLKAENQHLALRVRALEASEARSTGQILSIGRRTA